MRKVAVTKRILNEETRKWESKEIGIAIFHSFGVNHEEYENGAGNFSTAIIEWQNGVVENIPVENIKFVEPLEGTIEIKGLPEGWEAVAIIPNALNELDPSHPNYNPIAERAAISMIVHLKKKQQRRIVLEETGEIRDTPKLNHYNYFYTDHEGFDRYKVAREVKETDLSLPNTEDKESLRLSVDECKEIYKSLCKYHASIDALVLQKVRDFLNDSIMSERK